MILFTYLLSSTHDANYLHPLILMAKLEQSTVWYISPTVYLCGLFKDLIYFQTMNNKVIKNAKSLEVNVCSCIHIFRFFLKTDVGVKSISQKKEVQLY